MAVTGFTTKDVAQKSHCEAAPVSNDYTYSSPIPCPSQTTIAKVAHYNDHTYAEDSDVPTEPYGSDSDSKIDSVSTSVSSEA